MDNLLFIFQPMRKIGCVLMMSVLTLSVWAQKESSDVRTGNKLYKSSKFTEAEIAYRKGLVKNPKSFEANYNLGNALFKQKKYSEAIEKYNTAISLQPTEKKKVAASLHNVEESIKAYKSALKNNPLDDETRYNLAYAQMMLKKQQQQNKDKKDKNKDQNKDQKKDKQDQNKDQQKKDQQQQQPQQSKSQMSKENAQQILDALMQDEKNTQDKAKKTQARGTKKAEKDW